MSGIGPLLSLQGGFVAPMGVTTADGQQLQICLTAVVNKTSVAAATTDTQLIAASANFSRIGTLIYNGASASLNLGRDDPTGKPRVIAPGAGLFLDGPGAINGWWDAGAAGNAYLFEFTL